MKRALGGLTLALFAILTPAVVLAAPPLFTQPVDFCGKGGVEAVVWLEGAGPGPDSTALVMLDAAVGVTDRLDVGASFGMGAESGPRLTVSGPTVRAGFLVQEPGDGLPGIALSLGLALPFGRGSANFDAPALWLVAPLTLSLGEGRVLLHLNLGVTGTLTSRPLVRPLWGAAVDAAIFGTGIRAVAEAFAGDPLDPGGAPLGSQLGLYRAMTENIKVDLALAVLADPSDLGSPNWIARLGLTWSSG